MDKAKEILESGVSVFLQVGHGSNFLTEFAHGLQLSRRTSMFFALLTVVTSDFLVPLIYLLRSRGFFRLFRLLKRRCLFVFMSFVISSNLVVLT